VGRPAWGFRPPSAGGGGDPLMTDLFLPEPTNHERDRALPAALVGDGEEASMGVALLRRGGGVLLGGGGRPAEGGGCPAGAGERSFIRSSPNLRATQPSRSRTFGNSAISARYWLEESEHGASTASAREARRSSQEARLDQRGRTPLPPSPR